MTKNVLSKPKGREIKMGDEQIYLLSPINLNVLASLEEEFNCGLNELAKQLTNRQASSLRTLLYVLLKDNYPQLDKKQVGELVTLDNMGEISGIVTEVLTSARAIEGV